MKKLLILIFLLALLDVSAQSRYTGTTIERKRSLGLGMTIGGVALTTAAILEGPYNYGTYVTTSPPSNVSSQQVTYVTQPFWKQTPRNIMFGVGICFTATGLITAVLNRK